MKTAKACARLRRQLQRVSSGKRAGNCRSISPARRPRRRIVRASERPRLSVRLVLFGLEGTISAKGSSYAGAMPPWPQLTDGEIAAALDYVLSAWGNDKLLPRDFTLILPSDVAAARGQQMSAVDVHALRGRIVTTTPGGVADQATTALTFTAAQAERATRSMSAIARIATARPSTGEFGGAPLKGSYFRQRWASGSVGALYGKTKSTMPPDRPGQFSEQSYVDLTAFLLSQNGYIPGTGELPSDLDIQQKMSLKK